MTQPNDTGNYTTHDTPSSHALGADTQRRTVGTVMWTTEDADGTSPASGIRRMPAVPSKRTQHHDTVLGIVIVGLYVLLTLGAAK
jgi:hypothetical protein